MSAMLISQIKSELIKKKSSLHWISGFFRVSHASVQLSTPQISSLLQDFQRNKMEKSGIDHYSGGIHLCGASNNEIAFELKTIDFNIRTQHSV